LCRTSLRQGAERALTYDAEGGADAQRTSQSRCKQEDEVLGSDDFSTAQSESSAADGSVEVSCDKATKEQLQTSSKLTTNLIKLGFSHCYVSFSWRSYVVWTFLAY
jgi:hypothetical protein